MTINSYIKLDSPSVTEKRFRALSQGHRPSREKAANTQTTVSGNIDVQSAPTLKRFRYTLKVYAQDPAGFLYGTLSDLEEFFDLDVPPNNILTLTETDDSKTHSVIFQGRLEPHNVSPALSGPHAVFHVEVELVAV